MKRGWLYRVTTDWTDNKIHSNFLTNHWTKKMSLYSSDATSACGSQKKSGFLPWIAMCFFSKKCFKNSLMRIKISTNSETNATAWNARHWMEYLLSSLWQLEKRAAPCWLGTEGQSLQTCCFQSHSDTDTGTTGFTHLNWGGRQYKWRCWSESPVRWRSVRLSIPELQMGVGSREGSAL